MDDAPHAPAPAASASVGRQATDATQPLVPAGLTSESQAARLVEILDRYLAELRAGQAPHRQQLLADHPDLAEPLQACLAGLEFIHAASDVRAGSETAPPVLGDFRIGREIGRGGMGAVYEAQQMSLGRRVALKVLRFGGVSDPEAVQRFQREAETVARLHHTNIVPIFAVGSEQGVNYYAMQFIDGRSLDQVLRQHSERGETISPDTVARWGLQAAEALAHAHARGVIHRDVKPSNLLLDNEAGRIWLTDFGLAKRLDDVTLSMTGALLGTPRYMSPEQAAAAHHRLDHRTDIYSLGASLYELATGQPLFRGDSPHDVISQILTADPRPPRSIRPSLPRDLETILLKCLSKDAAQRYHSAGQVADDLRAFLDGRPIAARRATLAERTARWMQRQRRSVALTSAAVAATLLLVLMTAAGGYAWHRSNLALLMLKTDQPPLVAELFRDGQRVVAPITVPTQQRLEVPAGAYQLRLSGDGRLSHTFGLSLHAGESLDRKLDLDDQLLWKDVPVQRSYRLARFGQPPVARSAASGPDHHSSLTAADPGTQIIELAADGIRALEGTSGKTRWTLNLIQPSQALLKDDVRLVWPWDATGSGYERGLEAFDRRPWVVSEGWVGGAPSAGDQGVDLNGDGIGDLLLAARHQAWVIAINGDDGHPLWIAARGDSDAATPIRWAADSGAAVAYPPMPVTDQDGDGVTDILATWIDADRQAQAQRWLELISGASGETIWRFDLRPEWFALAATEETPYDLSWFYGSGGGYGSSGGRFERWQHYTLRTPSRLHRHGAHAYLPTMPQIVPPERQSDLPTPASNAFGYSVLFVAGKHLLRVDLRSGKPADGYPQVMGVRPAGQPRYGDFDGDDHLDVLLVEALPPRVVPAAPGLTGPRGRSRLAAWSPAKQSLLWQRDVEAEGPRQEDPMTPIPDWPQVADLNGDGADDVIVPDGCSNADPLMPPWGRLSVLDGPTGQPRWNRQLFNVDQQLDTFTVGPDIDDDGAREVYVASQWDQDFRLFVDCLSGSDGRTLWRLEQTLINAQNESGELRLANLSWYQGTGDGWPQLVVPARRTEGDVADRIALVSAGTGQLTHLAAGVVDASPGDLDADGIDDLILFQRSNLYDLHGGGTLQAFRGIGRQAWRAVAGLQVAVGDLDGDGVQDLAEVRYDLGQFATRSGASGRPIFRTDVASDQRFHVYPATARDQRHDLLSTPHDLNGDGTPDLLILPTETSFRGIRPLITAASGDDGRPLWTSNFAGQTTAEPCLLDCHDLDDDGAPEIFVVLPTDYGLADRGNYQGAHDPRLWLAVLSGRDGQLRWTHPLTQVQPRGGPRHFDLDRIWLEAAYADLDDDGTLDVVLPAQHDADSDRLVMRALSGRDGRVLWQFPMPQFASPRAAFRNVVPAAAADLDGDGRQEVVVLTIDRGGAAGQAGGNDVARVSVLTGSGGSVLWQWETPVSRWAHDVDGHADRLKNRLRPLLVRRPGGQHAIALSLWNGARALYLLDHGGTVVSQHSVAEGYNQGYGRRLWTVDADDDGGDELVFLTDTQLALLPPERLDQPIWTRSEAGADLNRVIGILPDPSAIGRIVVLGGGRDHSLRGIDPATGKTAWTCVGPASEAIRIDDTLALLLSPPAMAMPPHTLYQFGGQALVRRGTSTLHRSGQWQSFARPAPTLVAAAHDPRLLRPLPWKPADHELQQLPGMLGWSAFYAVALVAVPLLCVASLVRRRRWNLKTLLMLPVVAAIVMVAMMIPGGDRDFHSPWNKLMVAMAAFPVIFALLAFARWLRQGRWRLPAAWLTASLLAAGAMMAVSLAIGPAGFGSLQAGERYSWQAWYFMFLPVLYLMAWLLMITVVGAGCLDIVWRRWKGPPSPARLTPAAQR